MEYCSNEPVEIDGNRYTPEGGIVSLPAEADAYAVNRLGLARYINPFKTEEVKNEEA